MKACGCYQNSKLGNDCDDIKIEFVIEFSTEWTNKGPLEIYFYDIFGPFLLRNLFNNFISKSDFFLPFQKVFLKHSIGQFLI